MKKSPESQPVPPAESGEDPQLESAGVTRRFFLKSAAAAGVSAAFRGSEGWTQDSPETLQRKEALEKLRSQTGTIKKFFDGSYHGERAKGPKPVITLSEFQEEIDEFNQQIKALRDNGTKFNVNQYWGLLNNMPKVPETMTLRFASPPELEDIKKYMAKANEGALYTGQTMCLKIDKDGLSLLDYSKKPDQEPESLDWDSFLFALRSQEKVDEEVELAASLLNTGKPKQRYWREMIPQRAKEYGFDVYEFTEGPTGYELYIDLQAGNWNLKDGRYIRMEIYDFTQVTAGGIGKLVKLSPSLPKDVTKK